MSGERRARERGSSLIVVIMVAAFMLAVGSVLIMLTNTGKKISGNINTQEQAFNAAEAGFEMGKVALETHMINGEWTNVDQYTLSEPAGIDLPTYNNYFRKLTDQEVLAAISPTASGVLFYDQTYVKTSTTTYDPRYAYTVFLIDDEAGGGTTDPTDVMMVCIGVVKSGARIVSTSRLEILIGTTS